MRQWCRNTLAHVSKFNIHMLQPTRTVATIQSPLFSERICAEINIHINLDQSRPDLSHVTCRTMPRRPQPFAPSAL